jgi:hypothetical protein
MEYHSASSPIRTIYSFKFLSKIVQKNRIVSFTNWVEELLLSFVCRNEQSGVVHEFSAQHFNNLWGLVPRHFVLKVSTPNMYLSRRKG